jgi:hypothetical protein
MVPRALSISVEYADGLATSPMMAINMNTNGMAATNAT